MLETLLIYLFIVLLPGMVAGALYFSSRPIIERLLLGGFASWMFIMLLGALSVVIGVPFSTALVYGLLALEYLAALGLLVHFHRKGLLTLSIVPSAYPSIEYVFKILALLILLYISFTTRMSTLSPIFYDLDPYYYLYISKMLIVNHTLPLHDHTAWWPLNVSSHRNIPGLAFWQAFLFTLTHGGTSFTAANLYDLAYVANIYPPLAGMFMAFFAYLFFKEAFKEEWWAIAASLLLVSTPIITAKMLSGVFEAQPLSLLWHVAFLALLSLSIKERRALPLLVGVVFLYPLATTQAIIGIFVFLLFALLAYLQKEKPLLIATEYAAFGFALGSFLEILWRAQLGFKSLFVSVIVPLLLGAGAYLIERHFEELISLYKKHKKMIWGLSFVVLLLGMYAFGGIFMAGIRTGEYNVPLQRTIAEQQPAGSNLQGQLGLLAYNFAVPQKDVYGRVIAWKDTIPFGGLLSILTAPFQWLYSLVLLFLEKFGAVIVYIPKNPSVLFLLWGIALIFVIWQLYVFVVRRELDVAGVVVSILFLAISLPGLLKAKYIVQLALATGLAGGYFLAYGFNVLKNHNRYLAYILAVIFVLLVVDVNYYGHLLNVPYLSAAASEKPAGSPELARQLFAEFCNNTPEGTITFGQYCSMHENRLCAIIDPNAPAEDIKPLFDELCRLSKNISLDEWYSAQTCRYYLFLKAGHPLGREEQLAISLACGNTIPKVWMDAMHFIANNTPKDARITSWWDYGHWINYWGNRSAVLRNEHASKHMIGEIAYAYIMAPMRDFDNITKRYGSDYALFDREILFSGKGFGGKFYALNYLACADRNLTSVKKAQLESSCEINNLWESVYVTDEPCVVSPITKKSGRVAYAFLGDSPQLSGAKKRYCLSTAKTLYGEVPALYELDNKNNLGELRLHKAMLLKISDKLYNLIYTNDSIWYVNGSYVSGWEDHISKFYESPLYRAFILGNLPGWEKVFDNGYVKIYKRKR